MSLPGLSDQFFLQSVSMQKLGLLIIFGLLFPIFFSRFYYLWHFDRCFLTYVQENYVEPSIIENKCIIKTCISILGLQIYKLGIIKFEFGNVYENCASWFCDEFLSRRWLCLLLIIRDGQKILIVISCLVAPDGTVSKTSFSKDAQKINFLL